MIYSLSLQELTMLLKVAKSHDPLHHLMFLLAFKHGLRTSEVAKLTPKNLVYGNQLKVQRLKRSRLTVQPVAFRQDDLWNALTPLLARILVLKTQGNLDGPIFPSPRDPCAPISRFQVRRLIQRYGTEAGIAPVKLKGAHVLKHTLGTLSIKSGIEFVQAWMGHKSVASTGAYLHPDADATVRAIETAIGV